MEEIYRQNIIDNYKNPKSFGVLSDFDIKSCEQNVNCGDDVTVYIKFKDGKVNKSSFDGCGCAISTAASSILMNEIKNKTIDELKMISPGDIYNMLGIKISPNRTSCALLSYEAMNKGITLYK